jgi:hypothetical protein
MDEELFGPFGILFYVMAMLLFFSIPIIVCFVSGLIAILKSKLKTGMTLWSLILFSPIFLILILNPSSRGYIGQPAYNSLTLISITLPFVVPVWILGALVLYSIGRRNSAR